MNGAFNNSGSETFMNTQLSTDDEISTSQEMDYISPELFRSVFNNVVNQANGGSADICVVFNEVHFQHCVVCSKEIPKKSGIGDELSICESCYANQTQKHAADHEGGRVYEKYPMEQTPSSDVICGWEDSRITGVPKKTLPSCGVGGQQPYGFNMNVSDQKGAICRSTLDKVYLYVKKDYPCNINFVPDPHVPAGSKIRAMAIFSEAEHASEAVSRCETHKVQDRNKGVPFSDHFIRCESDMAEYFIDPVTKAQSVTVPYELPQIGQNYSTYIFTFACFGSCPVLKGKPIIAVFQLLWQDQVIGQRELHVKVCSTPSRDYKSIEKQDMHTKASVNIVPKAETYIKKEEYDSMNVGDQMNDSYMSAAPITSLAVSTAVRAPARVSSCPIASNDWPGRYLFNLKINIPESGKSKKKSAYSVKDNKLYIDINAECSVTFETKHDVPQNSRIRAMAVFEQPKHANDIVQRCMDHCRKDHDIGMPHYKHLIRCESDHSWYEECDSPPRLSVVVPYEPFNPLISPTYIYKFCCYSSCTGGINRRAVKVIFTLENQDEILGRRTFEVKICASPSRDCRNIDEKKNTSATEVDVKHSPISTQGPPGSTPMSSVDIFKSINIMDTSNLDSVNTDKNQDNEDLTITVHDKEIYMFLLKVQWLYRQEKKKKNSCNDATAVDIFSQLQARKHPLANEGTSDSE